MIVLAGCRVLLTVRLHILHTPMRGRSQRTNLVCLVFVYNYSCTTGYIIIIIIIDIHTRQGAIHEKEEREKEDSREAGSVDQWPAGLCPVANRGLKGSWTDHWPTHVQHRNRKCDIYN